MNEKIEIHLKKYPDEISDLFLSLRELVYKSVSDTLTEDMWAGLPSFYNGEKFVRLIPFKDHINIEAKAVANHKDKLCGFKITPKGMLQIFIEQSIPTEALLGIFRETLD